MFNSSKISNLKNRIKKLTFLYNFTLFFSLLIISILISNYLQIPILGIWEMFTIFHNFASTDAPLTFRIAERANIGGQGYALLDISRFIADAFGWTLNIIRSPSIIAGWISLCVFFIVAKRISGFYSALMAVLFLSFNETFSFFQNQLIVPIITFTICLIIIERIQIIDTNIRNKTAIILLAVATAFAGIHYAMGRFFALFLISFFVCKLFYLHYKLLGIKFAIKELKSFLSIFIFSLLIFFVILSPYNLIDLINIKTFFLPTWSEAETSVAEIIPTIILNLKIYFNTLFYLDDFNQTKNSNGLLFSSNFTLISPIFLPFVILGMLKAIRYWRSINYGISTPYALINVIFVITAIPPLFSLIVEQGSTITSYRMFNILIPIYLYGALGVNILISNSGRFKKYAFIVISCLFLTQVSILSFDRISSFKKIVFMNEKKNIFPKILTNGGVVYKKGIGFIEDQIIYRKYATKIVSTPSTNNIEIFNIDLNEISKISNYPQGIHFYENKNFYPTFIALYASELGENIAFVQAINSVNRAKLSGSGYRGNKRIFPAQMSYQENINYKLPNDLTFIIRNTGPDKIKRYIVTTKEEKKWLVNYLEKKSIFPKIISLSLDK